MLESAGSHCLRMSGEVSENGSGSPGFSGNSHMVLLAWQPVALGILPDSGTVSCKRTSQRLAHNTKSRLPGMGTNRGARRPHFTPSPDLTATPSRSHGLEASF